jgi:hypothetical protein
VGGEKGRFYGCVERVSWEIRRRRMEKKLGEEYPLVICVREKLKVEPIEHH